MALRDKAPFKQPVLWGTTISHHQEAVQNIVKSFPGPMCLERFFSHPSAWLICSRNAARLCFCQQQQEFIQITHPSTVVAQCCLTSKFKWELVFSTWHWPLTMLKNIHLGQELGSGFKSLACSISSTKEVFSNSGPRVNEF